ncbi:MAG: hypothetical protein DLM73_14500 [Chthoniobacterales bacterium]|nr:MAG: hypothetical protein DLM73_14500 [Chthoniobacterales bacterium]
MNAHKNGPNLDARRLNLGCGLQAPEDWLNVDGSLQAVFARWPRTKKLLVGLGIYPRSQASIGWPSHVLRLNLRRSLPFPANQFEAIYSSHLFEHLYREEAAALARECWRVLAPGGICRVVVPDLAAAIERYRDRTADRSTRIPPDIPPAEKLMEELLLHPRHASRGALGLYHRLLGFHNHKWMYDGASLKRLLADAGFVELKTFTSITSALPGLQEIESPSRIMNGAGVAVEGRKY